MKLKSIFIILVLAATAVAQTATPATPSTPAPDAKTCACCNHDKAEGGAKTGCADCCKDGKCPMMSGSHAGMKCPMMSKDGKMADGKMCCSSNKCPMHAKNGKGHGCCCGGMDEQKQPGV